MSEVQDPSESETPSDQDRPIAEPEVEASGVEQMEEQGPESTPALDEQVEEAITTEVEMVEAEVVAGVPPSGGGWLRFFVQSLIALLIPVTAAVAASWWLVRELPEEQILDRGGTMLSSTVAAHNVADALSTRIDVLRTLTSQGTVPAEIALKNDQYRGTPEVIDSIIRSVDEQWRAAFAAGAAPPRPVAENRGSEALRSFSSLFPGYVSLLATDREGAATSSTEVTPQFDYSEESWFQNAMSSGQIEMETIFDDGYQPLLSVALPLIDDRSRPSGVLRAIIHPHSVVAGAVDDLEAEDFTVITIGRDGELLFRSETVSGDAPIDAALLALADGADSAARKLELGGGRSVFASTAKVPTLTNVDVGAGLDWRVVVIRGSETLAGLVNEQRRQRTDLLLIVSLLALGLALVLAWWLSRPLRQLQSVQAIVGQEAWEQRLEAKGGIPVSLANGINELIDRTEVSENRRATAAAVVKDAEALAAQTKRFSDGDRLTAFTCSGAELGPLAASLEELRDELSRQLAEVDQGVRVASDFDKKCRQNLDWADAHEADARRNRKLKTEAKSLGVELARIANQGEQVLESIESEVRENRDSTAASQEKLVQQLTRVNDERERITASVSRSHSQLEDVDRSIQRLNELSDRTGVLALNGSIQAALAGDAGRGFALIANEVEQLSRQAIDLSHRAAATLADAIRDQSGARDRLAALTESVEEARSLLEESGEQSYLHSDKIESMRQLIEIELKRARQSGQGAQTMALELETQEAAIASWQESVSAALEGRQRVAEALEELTQLMASLHGRDRSQSLGDSDRVPLSLVQAPADFDDEVDGLKQHLGKV